MEGLLLSSLCRICNIHVAKYTCPRCSIQTCSLPCSRRHKLWASCSGIRDPTVFKSKSQLATPSGIDHDYNFLHSIEHRIERSEKLIVEERELVDKEELELARRGEDDRARKRRKKGPQHAGEEPIQKLLEKMGTTIERAPKGMRRNLENETNWSRNQRSINWQVEWIREGSGGRILSKAMGNKPIGLVYAAIMEEERKKGLSDEERRAEKKRKAAETKERLAKKHKSDNEKDAAITVLQDPVTGAWSLIPTEASIPDVSQTQSLPESTLSLPSTYRLYLLRPHTPSSFPKVLVPLDASKPLEALLRRRTVLEFPTIYMFERSPEDIPDRFMLEKDFLSATGQDPLNEEDTKMDDSTDESSEDDDSDTSSSESDELEQMEEGEIVPKIWGSSDPIT